MKWGVFAAFRLVGGLLVNGCGVNSHEEDIHIFSSGWGLFRAKREDRPDLDLTDPAAERHVIVQYQDAPTANHHRKVAARGGKLVHELGLVSSAHYSMTSAAARDLANDPEVVSIQPDREVHGALDLTAKAVNAPAAWAANFTGTGIGVAVIDSGISPNIPAKVSASFNFSGTASGSDDIWGHGTHVAGVVASSAPTYDIYLSAPTPAHSYLGVAYGSSLINLKALKDDGTGTDSSVISAIQWAVANKTAYNIRVMNLSLGRPVSVSYTVDPLCQAVEKAWKAGIVVVVSAGNYGRNNFAGDQGYGTITAPGNDPYVITVGAMNTKGTPARTDDVMASYSSKGPSLYDHIAKPDILAPGNLVVSASTWDAMGGWTYSASALSIGYPSTNVPLGYTFPGWFPQIQGFIQVVFGFTDTTNDPYHTALSGTSMAAPVVSGAAALLLQKYPSLTPDQVKARLMKTAYKTFPVSSVATDPATGATYTSYYDLFTVGAGYLDIAAAMANTDVAVGNAMSPAAAKSSTDVSLTFPPGSPSWPARTWFGVPTWFGDRPARPSSTAWPS